MNLVPQCPAQTEIVTTIISKQQTAIKRQIQQAIKAGDLHLLKKIFKLFKVVPNEEISEQNLGGTCLHYACRQDAMITLDYLLQLTYSIYKEEYSTIINLRTSEGWNLVMLTAIHGATNCLQLLLKYGGVKLYEKDNNGLRALDLALKYKNESVYKILSKQCDQFPMKTITEPAEFMTPCNVTELAKKEEQAETETLTKGVLSLKVNEDEKHQELLRKGKKLPCVVCSGEKGWLKYSECCGHPIHPLCVKGIKRCPQCSCSGFRLTCDVKCPEKAFTLETSEA